MHRIYNVKVTRPFFTVARLYHQSYRAEATAAANHATEHVPSSVPEMLNVRQQIYQPAYYQALSWIMDIRQRYIKDRFVFVEGRDLIRLLPFLGAKEEDIYRLPGLGERLYEDPTLPFRKSRNGRFCFDFDKQSVRRLEFQPFVLSTEEDFKRHDSGQVRVFDEVENELQLNTVFQALLVFKAIITNGVQTTARPNLDYERNQWVCTLFHLRTVTRPDLLGEPALEGVHTDGVDHTMTTFLGKENMAPNSAVTFMHDMQEQTGKRLNQITPELISARVQHRNLLDTLMIVDNERKHSVSPVYAIDPAKQATRDMLIFFTRKPVTSKHISASVDSLKPHRELPMELPLFVPSQQ